MLFIFLVFCVVVCFCVCLFSSCVLCLFVFILCFVFISLNVYQLGNIPYDVKYDKFEIIKWCNQKP